jgi:hypothetical protein
MSEITVQHRRLVFVITQRDEKTAASLNSGDETRPLCMNRGQEVQKSLCLADYNKHTGGTDKKDQLLQL